MNHQLILFAADNSYLARIRELHVAGLSDTGSFSLDVELDKDLVDIESSYADGFFMLAAWQNDPCRVIGMGALARIGSEYQIKRIRVDAEHRGRGVGKALLMRLLEEARRRGIPELTLDTSLQQLDAQRLYERSGFAHVGNVDVGGIPSRLYRISLDKPIPVEAAKYDVQPISK